MAADDARHVTLKVAGPGALIVAKAQKIAERVEEGGSRLVRTGKDCTDVLRLLRAGEKHDLAGRIRRLLESELSSVQTATALAQLKDLFVGPSSPGSLLLKDAAPSPRAGAVWTASASELMQDLLAEF